MNYVTPEGHDTRKLPRWAQHEIEQRNATIADLRWRLERAELKAFKAEEEYRRLDDYIAGCLV